MMKMREHHACGAFARPWALAVGSLLLIAALLPACGGSTPEYRPPSKSGALSEELPDVLFLVSTAMPAAALGPIAKDSPGIDYFQANGTVMEGAYSRFDTADANRADWQTMGTGAGANSWVTQMVEAGYRRNTEDAGDKRAFFAAGQAQPGLGIYPIEGLERKALEAEFEALKWFLEEPGERPRIFVYCALQGDTGAPPMTEGRHRVPLLFAATVGISKGERRPHMVSLADIGPTVLDLVGLWPEGQVTDDLHGTTFARILQKEPLVWRGFVLAKNTQGDSWVRSSRWRLIRYSDGRQLISYVMENPLSMSDDSLNPAAGAQLQGLGSKLEAWNQ